MSETKREYSANYRKPPLHTRFKKGQFANPRGRPKKNLPALLVAALNEPVFVTTNGRWRKITKREAVIAQLVNESAGANLRATKMLIDMMKDIEKKTDAVHRVACRGRTKGRFPRDSGRGEFAVGYKSTPSVGSIAPQPVCDTDVRISLRSKERASESDRIVRRATLPSARSGLSAAGLPVSAPRRL